MLIKLVETKNISSALVQIHTFKVGSNKTFLTTSTSSNSIMKLG